MTAGVDQIVELLERASQAPEGPVRTALCEDAVRLADMAGDPDWRFRARLELIWAAFDSGESDKLLVALSWCLAAADRGQGDPDPRPLLWACKMALAGIISFPDVSLAQIEALHDDVDARFRAAGHGLRMPLQRRMVNQLGLGYPHRAAEYRQLWRAAPRAGEVESPAWEDCFEVYYLGEVGRAEEALRVGGPLLDHPARDREVYPWVVHLLLRHLLERGDRDRAVAAHRRAYPMCAANPRFLSHVGEHLQFLARTGNRRQAVRLLERHLPWLLDCRIPSTRFSFALSAWAALRRFPDRDALSLRTPTDFPLWREDGRYPVAELAAWFAGQVRELERRFNARNGTVHYTWLVEKTLALSDHTIDWPVGK